jgi:hypothetical protein
VVFLFALLMQDICIVELREPSGWITIPLTAPGQADLQSGTLAAERPVHAFFYQVGGNQTSYAGIQHVPDFSILAPGAHTTSSCISYFVGSLVSPPRPVTQ